eukprot:jgi/Mesen1/8690/ME000517S08003
MESLEDDDFFGPQDDDYQRTTPFSRIRPPRVEGAPQNQFSSFGAQQGGNQRNWKQFPPEPVLSGYGAGLGPGGGQHDGSRSRAAIVSELKLGPIGHKDQTLNQRINFQQPTEVACFSRGADGVVHVNDRRCLTYRNNLNKIMGLAYSREEEWEMGVHKRGDTVYLDLATRPPSSVEEQAAGVVNANVEFCALMKTKLEGHRIVMGAEMDCYERDARNQMRYVELKTSRSEIQSFLAGVQRVVCGFSDITNRVKQRDLWKGGVCLAFTDRVLGWLYGGTDHGKNYVLRYTPGAHSLVLLESNYCPPAIEKHCS